MGLYLLLACLLLTTPGAGGTTPAAAETLRHRAEAERAERQGDADAAGEAAELYLDAAGLTALASAWSPKGPKTEPRTGPTPNGATDTAGDDSDARLREAVTFAATLAARHQRWPLLLRAIAWAPADTDLAPYHAPLARALTALPYRASELPAGLVETLAAGDPALAATLTFGIRAGSHGRQ